MLGDWALGLYVMNPHDRSGNTGGKISERDDNPGIRGAEVKNRQSDKLALDCLWGTALSNLLLL